MPKKSSKSKSKRKTLHQKYKIIKKVKEHKKKKAKELKKLGVKARPPKDPGIPAAWPFKEELLKEIEMAKAKEVRRRSAPICDALMRREGKESLRHFFVGVRFRPPGGGEAEEEGGPEGAEGALPAPCLPRIGSTCSIPLCGGLR